MGASSLKLSKPPLLIISRNTHIRKYLICFNLWIPFIPSRNLDEAFIYNHMAIMSLRSRSHVKASVVLTRADYLFIPNYIRSLKYYFKTYFLVWTRLELASYCLRVRHLSQPSHAGSHIYISTKTANIC